TLRLGDKGTVFVSSRIKDKIHAIVDKDGKREVKVLASGLYRPNGIVLHKGTLYIAELSQISKIENVEDKLDNPPKPTVIFSDLPKDEGHGWKYLTVGPDEKLYFQVGAPCNICMPSERHAKIYRLNLDGSGLEVVASGIRQIVGMDWHPTSKQLYFTENSRDWLSEDIPQDKFNRVTQPGKDNFGYPYCHQGNVPDQEFGWGRSCDEFTKPLALLGPHAGALGMRFYTGTMFPAAYRNQVIIARHGSWNRSTKIGGDLVLMKLKPDGTFRSMEPFVTGFLQNNNYVGRPADVLVMKDGSLLVSDDYHGAGSRVGYRGRRTVADTPLDVEGGPPPSTLAPSAFFRLSGEWHAQPRDRGHPRRFGSIPALRTVARRAPADLLRLPWRKRNIAASRDALARRAAGLLRHPAAAHVPRQAAHHRTDERDDQGTQRRRPAKGRRDHFEIAAAGAGFRHARRRPHGKSACAEPKKPLQFLPPIQLCRARERTSACRPARGLPAQDAARLQGQFATRLRCPDVRGRLQHEGR